jgi:hypothetical protein
VLKTFAASKFVGFRINLPEAEECWLGNSFDGTAFAKINGEHSAIQPLFRKKKLYNVVVVAWKQKPFFILDYH